MRVLATFGASFVFAVSMAMASSGFDGLDPRALRDEARSRGPQSVVAGLYNSPEQWSQFIDGVSSGSPEWLDTVAALAAGTDAGATSELLVALFMALGPAPERTLRLLTGPSFVNLGDAFEVEEVCGSHVYIDHEPKEARTLIEARLAVLRKTPSSDLDSIRARCIRSLEEARELSLCPPPQEMGLDGFCFPQIDLSPRLSEMFVISDCQWISGMTCKVTYNGKSPLPSEVFFTEFDPDGSQVGPRTRLIYPELAPGEHGAATFRVRTHPARIFLEGTWDGPWKNPY
jgi:hypothetical protein